MLHRLSEVNTVNAIPGTVEGSARVRLMHLLLTQLTQLMQLMQWLPADPRIIRLIRLDHHHWNLH